jgi:hypothetical protein
VVTECSVLVGIADRIDWRAINHSRFGLASAQSFPRAVLPKVTEVGEEGRFRPPIRAGRIRPVPSPATGLVLSFVIHGQIFRKSAPPAAGERQLLVRGTWRKVHPQVLHTAHLPPSYLPPLPHCDPLTREVAHAPPPPWPAFPALDALNALENCIQEAVYL